MIKETVQVDRYYLFLVQAEFNTTNATAPIFMRIIKFAKLGIELNQDPNPIITAFFEVQPTNVITAWPFTPTLNTPCGKFMKLEFIYFYYMYVNYLKDGKTGLAMPELLVA